MASGSRVADLALGPTSGRGSPPSLDHMNGSAHEPHPPEPTEPRLSLPLVQVVFSGALRLGEESRATGPSSGPGSAFRAAA